jgi:tetratricopeptide (TPR) repeat protein
MQAFIVLASLAIAIGAVVWIVIVVRKYQARKAFEREREAQFMAEMLRAKPDLARAPPAPVPAAAVEAAPPPSDPLAAAAASIRDALAAGRAADAAKAFLGIVAERTRLTLEPPVWEGLGRALLAQGAFLEAAWALHAGAALAGDLPGAQKRLVEVASKAGDAGQPQHAVKLYQTLLAKYPQSAYADFVRADIKEQEKKLKG